MDAIRYRRHELLARMHQRNAKAKLMPRPRPRVKLSGEVGQLERALQRIADLPPPDKLTRPYRQTPQRIAILALKRLAAGRAALLAGQGEDGK